MIAARKAQVENTAVVPGAWSLALALALVHLVAAIDRHLLALVLVPIQAELGLGDTQLGFLHGTAYVLLYAGAVIPAGALADRFDRRRIVMVALAVWSLGTLACALATSFPALVGGRMIVGLGQAALVPAAASLIADGFGPGGMGRPIAVFTSAATLGRGMALLAGGLLLGLIGDGLFSAVPLQPWRIVFLMSLGLNVAAFAWFCTVVEPARTLRRAGPPPLRTTLADRWRLYLAYFGCAAATILLVQVVAAWAPTLLVRGFDLTPAGSGLIFGPIVIVFGPAGNVAGGWLIDRLARRGDAGAPALVVALALVAAMIAGATACLAEDLGVAIAALAATTFALGGATPVGLVAVQRLTPASLRGRMTGGFILGVTLISLGIGPVMVGWLSETIFTGRTGLAHALLATLCVVSALGAAAAVVARSLETGDAAAAAAPGVPRPG
ncbi:MFS transporter [Aurantimonas sp. 22II-16-19i]|uniref:MFS transporter n=1 Tax=Aurantimonas sp. 22II-16-19i TaxID=1317114 RepID=UPI0009F7D869|nr:MFS transporter [Aurantimonas sp. 22II-16-19i]ORE90453.1 major facilitator transporter [Aurantimonas sp. 22II-16-19i]